MRKGLKSMKMNGLLLCLFALV